MRVVLLLAAASTLGAVLACGSTVEPGEIQGTWYLHTYNDSSMPGQAVFRSGNPSELIEIDSVRLYLGTESACGWIVHLANEVPNQATSCLWELNVGDDDLVVTVDEGFVLRGDVLPALLRLEDPNGNVLEFQRDPAMPEPEVPDPI